MQAYSQDLRERVLRALDRGDRPIEIARRFEVKHLSEDVSEILEYVPARFKAIRQVRPKLACACCERIVQAEAPSRPIERGVAGPGLLAHVLVSKYCDHCVSRTH